VRKVQIIAAMRPQLARGDAQTGMETYCLNTPTIDSLIVDWPVRAEAS
jgi:hypothetical protein